MIIPGVPEGCEIRIEQDLATRDWCISLFNNGKEYAEALPHDITINSEEAEARIKKIYHRLEAQSGIKFNWEFSSVQA